MKTKISWFSPTESLRIKQHFRKCMPLLSCRRAWLLVAAILGQTALSSLTSAQTCQDGCFFSNTYQGQGALSNFTSGGNETAFGSAALTYNTTGTDNTALGTYAMLVNTTGGYNTAVGSNALYNNNGDENCAIGVYALFSNTTGSYNTATGLGALEYNTTGAYNTANGANALVGNATGSFNTAVGWNALSLNNGNYNTATGAYALWSIAGDANTATGYQALYNNEGGYNTAVGEEAAFSNVTGTDNAVLGQFALYSNTTGLSNTAVGEAAMYYNNGSNNTAVGYSAINKNTTGGNNTALGNNALYSNTTGSNNIAIGVSAGTSLTTGSNNIDIGNNGVAGEAKTIRVGKSGTQTSTFIAGISGTTVAGGVGVIIGSTGKLGTVVSSARFKEAIKPMDKTSEAILALKPVTFRYKKELDPDGIPQFGLVAEDVEKVNPDLVARDEQGKPYTVRYEAVNAMLLNEFLKEHRKAEDQTGRLENQARKIEEQEAVITQLKREMGAVAVRLNEQDSKIQKVSARLELSKPAPQLVTTIGLQSQSNRSPREGF
jgi:hypothetical protein